MTDMSEAPKRRWFRAGDQMMPSSFSTPHALGDLYVHLPIARSVAALTVVAMLFAALNVLPALVAAPNHREYVVDRDFRHHNEKE
jgi:hypothetical protein